MSETVDFAHARAPDGMRLYAIGDVHGCAAHLAEMHRQIAAEIARDRPRDWRVIHLGDYIDRGPDSKGVLARLIDAKARDPRYVALAGNHDVGLLNFLAAPSADSLFIRYGGVETAASYGVTMQIDQFGGTERGHAALLRALPRSHRAFVEALDYSESFGDFFFCHAGIKPGIPLDRQKVDHLIWIRSEFLDCPTLHPKVVVHGHTPTDRPEAMPNRVNVDTGCYRTGMLTALVVDDAEKRFLSVSL